MCRALLKRAFGLLDSSGILRKPSLESLRAILLLKMLQIAEAHAEDDNDKAQEMYSECESRAALGTWQHGADQQRRWTC